MTARQATPQEQIVMGFPLGFDKQTELAEALKQAAKQKATTGLGVWCAETGFCVLAEVCEGKAALWHAFGPVNVHQAKRWFKGMQQQDNNDPVGMMV